jgi:predicted porin
MKTQHKLTPVLLLLISGGAYAQSNVTIYGSLDAGVSSFNDELGGRNTKIDTGNRSPNRLGFRGSEDLGNGMRAIFLLEAGYNVDDGQLKRSNTLFNRNAWVGLAGSAGTISAGHMPDLMYDYLRYTANAFQKSVYFNHPGNLDNQANSFQVDNAIKYETPSMGGFTFGAMNGFGEQADAFNKGRTYSLGMRYVKNNLLGGLAYTVSNNRSLNLGSSLGIGSLLGQTLNKDAGTGGATYTNFAANQVNSAGITAGYKFGTVTPHAMFSQIKFVAGNTATMRNAEVGADISLTANNTFGLSVATSRLEQARWHQLNVIDTIALSPRTFIYAAGAVQRASGQDIHAVIFTAAPSGGQLQRVLRVGIDHLF